MPQTAVRGRPGRPKEPQKRARLLAIARGAFAEAGYRGTSLSTIAARAGQSKATVLHHFGSKEALYVVVMGELVADLGALVTAAAVSTGDYVERLDALGETVVEYLAREPAAAKLLLAELVGGGPYAHGAGAVQVELAMRGVAEFLAAGMRSGDLAEQPPGPLAMSIVGMHLVYFAAADVTEIVLADSPFDAAAVAARKAAVKTMVRAMCGVATR